MSKYTLVKSKQYLRSYNKFLSSKANNKSARRRLATALEKLLDGHPLPQNYKDHQLKGEFVAYRECHIKSDILLVYQIKDEVLVLLLVDIGTHSQIFQ